MKRLLYAFALAVAMIGPLSAAAAPTPTPALSTLLMGPPAGYAVSSSPPFNGQFDATAYAAQYGSSSLGAGLTLIQDGFVDGYGKTWAQRSTGRALIEFVIAFRGGKGAKSWLGFEETADKNSPGYKHANSISGIDSYYGVHLTLTPTGFVDAYSFVKGNDMFGVGFVSAKDNVLPLAKSQAMSQYRAAPAETIPTASWPENAPSQRPQTNFLATIIGGVLVIVGIGAVIRFVMVRRRST